MKRIVFLIFSFSHFLIFNSFASPIEGLLSRILPNGNDAQRFEWQIDKGASEQYFTISSNGKKVRVTGADNIAVATGINWFLQHHAGINISWNAPVATLPRKLPVLKEERHRSSVDYRYYLNFCTHSYSMAFWDWERWQQEIDWMALHGINLPLAITGMETVWQRTLENYGYTQLSHVNEFVCGSAYYGWFFMNNLTAWGGPQPESWYAQRTELARRIFCRMQEFGMSPVVPGYVGMVPRDFLSHAAPDRVVQWQASDIVDGGRWNGFTRPAFVVNTERLREFAAAYYEAFDQLFGTDCKVRFFAIDPFHEGAVPPGVTDAAASVRAMYEALLRYQPEAVWVCQHWQDNPTPVVTHTMPAGRLLILDLHGDSGADVVCSGHHTTADGTPHDWVWGQVSNFGGNVGLFGRMDNLIRCFYEARDNALDNHLRGIGALPEGIENNPMLYDLLYALPWTTTDYTRQTWLSDYVCMRYGLTPSHPAYAPMLSAWQRLAAGPYNCPSPRQQGTTESVFLMRPALQPGRVSTWAASSWYWDIADLRRALREMLSVAPYFAVPGDHPLPRPAKPTLFGAAADNYAYDLVDLCRQCMADYGKLTLDSIATTSGSSTTYQTTHINGRLSRRFLTLILAQDTLLATRSDFRLGRWTEMARRLGTTPEESDLYERNARMLLTTWGQQHQCDNGGLHDYANREWQGLLSAYYYPRWAAYFRGGTQPRPWFAQFEWPFVQGTDAPATLPPSAPYAYGSFTSAPQGSPVSTVRHMVDTYLPADGN